MSDQPFGEEETRQGKRTVEVGKYTRIHKSRVRCATSMDGES